MKIYKDMAVKHGARIALKHDDDEKELILFTNEQLTEYSRAIIGRAITTKPYKFGEFDMSHEDAEAMQ